VTSTLPHAMLAGVAPDDTTTDDLTADEASAFAVRSQGLTKRFGSGQVAVDGIGLQVLRGSVYGFIGPNGSGKTTTIRMLLGLVRPTAGRSWLLGQPMPQAGGSVLPRVGVLVEGPAFQPYLSGRANLARLDACAAATTRSNASGWPQRRPSGTGSTPSG
jgi:ABC-type uncharacterized transport system ATPase subunit